MNIEWTASVSGKESLLSSLESLLENDKFQKAMGDFIATPLVKDDYSDPNRYAEAVALQTFFKSFQAADKSEDRNALLTPKAIGALRDVRAQVLEAGIHRMARLGGEDTQKQIYMQAEARYTFLARALQPVEAAVREVQLGMNRHQ